MPTLIWLVIHKSTTDVSPYSIMSRLYLGSQIARICESLPHPLWFFSQDSHSQSHQKHWLLKVSCRALYHFIPWAYVETCYALLIPDDLVSCFRGNLVVAGAEAFTEDQWTRLQLGSQHFQVRVWWTSMKTMSPLLHLFRTTEGERVIQTNIMDTHCTVLFSTVLYCSVECWSVYQMSDDLYKSIHCWEK